MRVLRFRGTFAIFSVGLFSWVISQACSSGAPSEGTANVLVTKSLSLQALAPSQKLEGLSGSGWGDGCLSCICSVLGLPKVVGYSDSADNPTVDWLSEVGFCRKQKMCRWYEYINTWSPFLAAGRCLAHDVVTEWKTIPGKAVCFYEHAYFGGKASCYGPGAMPDLPSDEKDTYSSVRILGGATLQYWEHPNYDGQTATTDSPYTTVVPDGLNDRIESFQIW